MQDTIKLYGTYSISRKKQLDKQVGEKENVKSWSVYHIPRIAIASAKFNNPGLDLYLVEFEVTASALCDHLEFTESYLLGTITNISKIDV